MPVMGRDTGKVRLHQAIKPVGSGTASGALWGSLIGRIFRVPVMGLVIRAASSARTR